MKNVILDHQPLRVVVMGGSKGIGRAISEGFAAGGASLAIAARGAEGLRALGEELAGDGRTVHTATCNVSNPASVARFMPIAADALGGIDVLVNCASSFSQANDEESWRAAFDTDLMGSVRGVNAALPFLTNSGRASVINLSSVDVRQAAPDRLPYVAMKAALEQYTASAARLYGRAGLRFNCVVAGSTDFPGGIWDRISRTDPERYEATRRTIPLGGFATPAHIADVVLFLASAQAAWVTGRCIVVDGGQAAGSA